MTVVASVGRKVRDYMSAPPVTLSPGTDLQRAVHLLLQLDLSAAPVVDAHGGLVGILSEKDCFRAAFAAGYYRDPPGTVGDCMQAEVTTIDADLDIVAAMEMFYRGRYRRLPVLEGGRLVGQLSRRDALRALDELVWPAAPGEEPLR